MTDQDNETWHTAYTMANNKRNLDKLVDQQDRLGKEIEGIYEELESQKDILRSSLIEHRMATGKTVACEVNGYVFTLDAEDYLVYRPVESATNLQSVVAEEKPEVNTTVNPNLAKAVIIADGDELINHLASEWHLPEEEES